MMNREMRRLSEKIGTNLMKKSFNEFEEIPFSELQSRFEHKMKRVPDRAWKNNHYVVQCYRCERSMFGKLFDKIMIRRNDSARITDFYSIQNIKNLICGEDVMAVQVFPEQDKLVDVANLYWLFVESGKL